MDELRPIPWTHPKWDDGGRTHNWRNHVSDEMKERWDELSELAQRLIYEQADNLAAREEWN